MKGNQNQLTSFSTGYEEFIHYAAHDLDAPLRKLMVLVERMKEKIRPGTGGAEYLPRIESNVDDMRNMIEGLLKLAESYSSTATKHNTDIDEIVRGVIDSVRKKNAGREINVNLDMLPVLEGDPEAYRLLFHNLLENAVRFSKKGSPVSISITSVEVTDEEKRKHLLQNGIIFYKITIRDKGIGFKQDDAEKIFLPFVRLHGKSEYPGSGIGLAICKKIIDRYHGVIYGEGIENEGAGIVLFLPQSLN
ncbi:MAG: HAMP domain-containing histidine kinase [Chitinophagaceae bacterium]|nr:MAG: HAMP domain-containing histidine kinase [Chitinophagaceae bacterium]